MEYLNDNRGPKKSNLCPKAFELSEKVFFLTIEVLALKNYHRQNNFDTFNLQIQSYKNQVSKLKSEIENLNSRSSSENDFIIKFLKEENFQQEKKIEQFEKEKADLTSKFENKLFEINKHLKSAKGELRNQKEINYLISTKKIKYTIEHNRNQ